MGAILSGSARVNTNWHISGTGGAVALGECWAGEFIERSLAAFLGRYARCYPIYVPQRVALPCLTFRQLSGGDIHTLDGAAGIAAPEYEVACYCRSYAAAKRLARAVRVGLQGYSGMMLDSTIHSILIRNHTDTAPSNPDGSDSAVFVCTLVFEILHAVA